MVTVYASNLIRQTGSVQARMQTISSEPTSFEMVITTEIGDEILILNKHSDYDYELYKSCALRLVREHLESTSSNALDLEDLNAQAQKASKKAPK